MNFRDDGERDRLGRVGAEIEPDRRVQPGALLRCHDHTVPAKVLEDSIPALFGAEQTEIGEGKGEQVAKNGDVMNVAMRHHDRQSVGSRCGARDESFG